MQVNDWVLFLYSSDSSEQQLATAKQFINLLTNPTTECINITGRCAIGSKAAKNEDQRNGANFAADIKSVRRIKSGWRNGARHDLMRAVTSSGETFEFFSDDYNGDMYLLMADVETMGKIEKSIFLI